MGLSEGWKSFPIGLAVLIQYRSVTASQPPSQPPSHVPVAITLNARASSLKREKKTERIESSRVIKRRYEVTRTVSVGDISRPSVKSISPSVIQSLFWTKERAHTDMLSVCLKTWERKIGSAPSTHPRPPRIWQQWAKYTTVDSINESNDDW